MGVGPIFEFELLTTARRGRYYAVRAACAAVILLIYWQMYLAWEAEFGAVLTPGLVSRFAHATLLALVVWLEVLVLALTPTLAAGAIASEKQGKTLGYVLATPLGSGEIVVGKLLARLLHAGIALAVAMPVLSMLVLFGGVDPRLIGLAVLVPASGVFLLAALGVLASVYARGVREALFLTYAVEGVWLLAPTLLRWIAAVAWPYLPWLGEASLWLADWLSASSPVDVVKNYLFLSIRGLGGGAASAEELFWLAGLQSAAGVVLVAVAAWRLRPVYRRQQGGRVEPRRDRPPAFRWVERPDCGDRPMAWKERHALRGTRLTRAVGGLLAFCLGLLVLSGLYRYGVPAATEAWNYGVSPFTPDWQQTGERYRFHNYLHFAVAMLSLPGLVLVAAAAGGSVTAEHEADTWTGLTATDLTGPEVLLAKRDGAMLAGRRVGLVVAALLACGVATGAVHPLSLLTLPLVLIVFARFAATLGVWVSVRLRSTWRAQFLTVALLFLANITGQAAWGALRPFAPIIAPGMMPVHVAWAVLPRGVWDQVAAGFHVARTHLGRGDRLLEVVDSGDFWSLTVAVLALAVYAGLTRALRWDLLRRFEVVAGRARRGPEAVAAGEAGLIGRGTRRPR